MLIVTDRIQIPEDELQISYARSGGPGGQNVNKVSSKAVVRWQIHDSPALPEDVRIRFLQRYGNRVSRDGLLTVSSQRYRDQRRNLEDCRQKLADLILAVAEAPVIRQKTRPSRAAKQRRLNDKHVRSEIKQSRRKPES